MRWLFAGQNPAQNISFGYGPATEVRRRLLTLWNSYRFLVQYAEIDGFVPTYADLETGPPAATPLDRWIVARAQVVARGAAAALDDYATPPFTREVEAFVDDLSNWYIRGSRARFWKSEDDADKQAAFRTLWYGLVQTARLIAPVMPFLAEELWQTLVRDQCPDAPPSVHLAGYPVAVDAHRRPRAGGGDRGDADRDPARPDGAGEGRPAGLEAPPAAGGGRRRGARLAARRARGPRRRDRGRAEREARARRRGCGRDRHDRAGAELPRRRQAPRQGGARGAAAAARGRLRAGRRPHPGRRPRARAGRLRGARQPARGPDGRARGRDRRRRRHGARRRARRRGHRARPRPPPAGAAPRRRAWP